MSQLQAVSQQLLAKYAQLAKSERPTVPSMGPVPMDQAEKSLENATISLVKARDSLMRLQQVYMMAVSGGLNNPPSPFQHFEQKLRELEHLIHFIEQVGLNPIG